jgi:hypothetical protein
MFVQTDKGYVNLDYVKTIEHIRNNKKDLLLRFYDEKDQLLGTTPYEDRLLELAITSDYVPAVGYTLLVVEENENGHPHLVSLAVIAFYVKAGEELVIPCTIEYGTQVSTYAIKRPDGRVFYDEEIYNSEEEYLAEVIRKRAKDQEVRK